MKLRSLLEAFNTDDDLVIITDTTLEKLPSNLRKVVNGSFVCSGFWLTTLVGSPTRVEKTVNLSSNDLHDLIGGPEYVGGSFYAQHNKLTTLEGAPRYVGDVFNCSNNRLTSLIGVHEYLPHVGRCIYLNANPIAEGGCGLLLIEGLKKLAWSHPAGFIIAKYIGKGEEGLYDCQQELIEAGLEEYAKL